MKTYNMVYRIFKAMSLMAMTLVLANCGKSDNGGNTTNTTTGYVLSNGQCLYNGVATGLQSCQSVTTAGYGWYNNVCYQVGGGVYNQTSSSYCASYPSYYMSGSICYQTINGQQTQVATTYCSGVTATQTCNTTVYNNGYNNGYNTGTCSQVCSGIFYGMSGGYYPQLIQVQCNPGLSTTPSYSGGITQLNCSGLTLQSQTGQIVSCQ